MYEKKNIVRLNIETKGEHSDVLSISVYEQSSSPLSQKHDHKFSLSVVEKYCQEMLEFLNSSTNNSKAPEVRSKLYSLGSVLCDELLPAQIKKDLQTSKADYLILEISSDLVHIFWELLVLTDKFLCQLFRMGRLVKTKQEITKSTSKKPNFPLHMWILADTKGNLPSAAKEGQEIFNRFYLQNDGSPVIEAQLDPIISKIQLIEKIRFFDIIHFAGHTENSSSESSQKGWQLSTDSFSAADIKKMEAGPSLPAIVFSNACQSVGSTSWEVKKSAFDLAGAFLLGGTRHYIGTFWDIIDDPSSNFALFFYEHLLNGNTIGDAIHYARNELIKKGDNACWASYLLYGDPTEVYFDQDKGPEIEIKGKEKLEKINDPKKIIELENTQKTEEKSGIEKQSKPDIIDSLKSQEKVVKRTTQKNKSSSIFLYSFISVITVFIIFSIMIYLSCKYFFFPKDTWTSPLTTLAVNYDDSFDSNFIKHDTIKHAINMDLQDYGRFILIERGRFFETIKKELGEWEILPMDKKFCYTPAILPADVFVFFQVDNEDLLLTVCQAHTSRCPIYTIGTIHSGRFLNQKEISKNLISELKQKYPIRGKIKDIDEENIYLNIGHQVGVKIGQKFQTVSQFISLTINTVTEDYSTSLLSSENAMVQIGWKVKLY